MRPMSGRPQTANSQKSESEGEWMRQQKMKDMMSFMHSSTNPPAPKKEFTPKPTCSVGMAKAITGAQYESTNAKIEKYNSVYSTFFKGSSKPQSYKNTKESWTERVSASDHPNTKCNFKIGYYRETGIVSTQMLVNKQAQEGYETENNTEMKETRDKYRRRNQSSIHVRDKNSKTLEDNPSVKAENRINPAGGCYPKYEVNKKSMADHLSNGYK